jgi:hypothetical protein
MLVTPYCKRIHPPWAQDNTKAAGSPLLFSPLCVPSRADPSGLGHAATIYSSVQGPPGVETPTVSVFTGSPIHPPSRCSQSDVPFVFPAFALFFLPNLLPPPTIAARAGKAELSQARLGEARWNSEPSQARLGHFASSVMRLGSI